jgi:hypothetical protein
MQAMAGGGAGPPLLVFYIVGWSVMGAALAAGDGPDPDAGSGRVGASPELGSLRGRLSSSRRLRFRSVPLAIVAAAVFAFDRGHSATPDALTPARVALTRGEVDAVTAAARGASTRRARLFRANLDAIGGRTRAPISRAISAFSFARARTRRHAPRIPRSREPDVSEWPDAFDAKDIEARRVADGVFLLQVPYQLSRALRRRRQSGSVGAHLPQDDRGWRIAVDARFRLSTRRRHPLAPRRHARRRHQQSAEELHRCPP